MSPNELPKMNTDKSETGCCPRFDPSAWDGREIVLEDRLFAKAAVPAFLHIPLGLNGMYRRICAKLAEPGAAPADSYLTLTREVSPWRAEYFFLADRDLPGEEMVRLSGTFVAKAFEGEYREVPRFVKEAEAQVRAGGREPKETLLFYTTCPKCAKVYGKNHIVALVRV